MNRTLAGTPYSASGVHALVEIGMAGELSAKDLCEKLLLEKSTVSRLVKSLKGKGEVTDAPSDVDGRVKCLRLTDKGEETLAEITGFAERRVVAALDLLDRDVQQDLVAGVQAYAAALRASRVSGERADTGVRAPIGIKRGFTPTIIGRVVEMHASYYSRAVGFGAAFEA
ncbi:MAG: MarR family winged helix-turn-helix transcriptional regulator, partial [Alphaproteobacteria bacterium]|nr:MarR family winged helix-turn-helix transcriptional regulator [Alphaproteobacteria bacterium]